MNTIENNSNASEELIVNNILIAKFLGTQVREEGIFKLPLSDNYLYTYNELHFHSDWNWLMLVVDKLTDIGVEVSVLNVFHNQVFKYKYVSFCYHRFRLTNVLGVGENRYKDIISATYNACVEFIKWYNTQNN